MPCKTADAPEEGSDSKDCPGAGNQGNGEGHQANTRKKGCCRQGHGNCGTADNDHPDSSDKCSKGSEENADNQGENRCDEADSQTPDTDGQWNGYRCAADADDYPPHC